VPKTRAPTDQLKIKYTGARPKRVKRYVEIQGPQPLSHYDVFESTLVNVERCLAERVFHVENNGVYVLPPQPVQQVFERRLQYIIKHMRNCCKNDAMPVPYNDEEIIKTCAPHKRKKTQLALTRMDGRKATRKDSNVTMFVKPEKTEHMRKVDPIPRAVLPRDIVYAIELARFLRPIEKTIFQYIDKLWGNPTIMKGYNAAVQGGHFEKSWNRFKRPAALDLDANRFDEHVSEDALKFEHKIYRLFYQGKDLEYLNNLLRWQLENKITCRTTDGYVVRCTRKGGRMSGDINTSLGNCGIMTSKIHWIVRKLMVMDNVDLFNNGDDCILIGEYEDIVKLKPAISPACLQFGFTMKIGPIVRTLEHISFCQTNPVFNGKQYVMCRNPHIAIAKDCIMIDYTDSQRVFNGWRKAVSLGGMSLTDGIPIYTEFYKSMGRGINDKDSNARFGKVDESGFWRLSQGMEFTNMKITDEARFSFWVAYGITPHEQVLIEEAYKKMEIGPLTPAKGLQHHKFKSYLTELSQFYEHTNYTSSN